MIDMPNLHPHMRPFAHWVAPGLIDQDTVRAINADWPAQDHPGWRTEGRFYAVKRSLLFPQRLPDAAQALAAELYAPGALAHLSELLGMHLHPDPWFTEGPTEPRLGGGLHEIHRGGMLGIHVDFEAHPSGLRRVANLLVYLNEGWQVTWGGALELHGPGSMVCIAPMGGSAVFFRTDANSWHGHPHPLECPADRQRRSLALYYYAADDGTPARPKTIYRRT